VGTKKPQSKETGEATINAKDFGKTVHMLIELLGRDMESASPSRDRDFLIAVREGLFRVEVAGQLFECIKTFRELLLRNFPEADATPFTLERHIGLTKMAAKLSVQPMVSKAQIRDLLREFGINAENTQMAIFGITQFIEMIRRMPMKFFTEQDHRLQIITTLQHELDQLIVQEEAEEMKTDGE
jgi:hypothetical protein